MSRFAPGASAGGASDSRADEHARLLELTSDAVFVRGAADDKLTSWNAAAERLYGYRAEQALGRTPHELLRTVLPQSIQVVRETLAREGQWEGELRHRSADGRPVVVHSRQVLERDERGEPRTILEVNSDITERKRQERALGEAEARWRAAVEHLPGGALLIFDDNLRYVEAGGEMMHAFGLHRGDLIGRSATATSDRTGMGRQVGDRLRAAYRAAVQGRATEMEVELSGRWLDLRVVPLQLPDGRRYGMALSIDVTDRKAHEHALRDAEARWHAALENMPDGSLAIFDSDLRVVEAGGDILKAIGLGRGDVIGARVEELAPRLGLDRRSTERLTAAYRAAIEGRQSRLEVEVRGHTLDARVVPLRLAGRERHGMVLGINVTDRKRHERELAAAEVRWRAAVDNLPGGSLLIFDENLRYVEIGGEVLRVVEVERMQVIGQRVGYGVYPELARRIELAAQEALQGNPTEFEFELRGGTFYARVISFALEDGERYGMMVSVNVTARRRLEDRLRQVAKLEAVGQLAGGIAHDFNNLLTAISGYCALARDRLGESDELTEIARAAERAAQLTGQLLAFSRRQTLRPAPVDVAEVARQLMPMLRRLIGEHIRVSLHAADGLPLVLADRGQLEQVIVNLAVNARDAMPAGGVLVVDVAPAADGQAVSLVVSDTGTGMTADVLEHAFEPFFTTKELGRGTGLGLATVHGIVTQTGGEVTLESEPGRGTAVRVTLPAARERDAQQPRHAAPDRSGGVSGRETVLLCEDDPAVRQLIELLLVEHGYTVLVADHPAQAITLATEHAAPIHVLLSDIVMPDMSGPALAERLQAGRPELRTMFVSGYSADALRGSTQIPDDSAFVQKPFSAQDLLQALRGLLDQRADPGAAGIGGA